MDSFKVNYYLQPETIKTKKCLILISVLWEDNRLRTTLNLSVPKIIWDNKRQLLKDQGTDSVRINSKLIAIRHKLSEYYTKYKMERKKEPPKIEVKEIIQSVLEDREPRKIREKKEKQKTFFEYFKEFVKDSEKGIRMTGSGKPIQPTTIKSYITTQNHLEEFLKTLKTEIDFTNINDAFFVALTKYFGKKKLSNNSQGRAIKILKTFLHYAYQQGYHDDLRFVKILKVFDEETSLIALTADELESIEKLKPPTPKLDKIKDLFLVQVYTGIRFSDLYNLKPENIDYNDNIITLKTLKTQDNLIIPMTNKLQTILKKYNEKLPKISSQKYNDFIKEIGKFAGIDTLIQQTKFIGNKREDVVKKKYELMSSHTARRSFITLTLKKGILPEMIMKVSGHKSRKSFQRYVRISQTESVDAIKKAWE